MAAYKVSGVQRLLRVSESICVSLNEQVVHGMMTGSSRKEILSA